MERAGDMAATLVHTALERTLFFAERRIDLLQDKIRSMEVRMAEYDKTDYSIQQALNVLRRPLKFGDLEQIKAARFLESIALEFTLEDFIPRKEAESESGDSNQAAG